MPKYKRIDYCQIYNKAIKKLNNHNRKISYSTRWLYIHLCLLEHRLTGKKESFFYRSIKEIAKETHISYRLVIEGIKKLKKLKLIQTWQMHWTDPETKKQSEKHITAFRILNI
ncbi:hypothetical protein ES705_33498 [subsurface metagenome]